MPHWMRAMIYSLVSQWGLSLTRWLHHQGYFSYSCFTIRFAFHNLTSTVSYVQIYLINISFHVRFVFFNFFNVYIAVYEVNIAAHHGCLSVDLSVRLTATMINTIGFSETERALKLGKLYSSDDALRVNLVDEVVPETDVIEAARRAVAQYLSIPGESLDWLCCKLIS